MTIAWTGRAARTLAAAVTDRAPAVAVVTADPDGTDIVTAGCSPGDGFEIGSITKTMTGTLLADAAAGGRMSLDDPVGRWLDAGENADITVGELATHTSGLPRLSPSHVAGTADPYAFLTADTARICTPLAMICTGIDAATSRQGHRAGKPVSPWTHHLAEAGGVVATAEDMARVPARVPDSTAGSARRRHRTGAAAAPSHRPVAVRPFRRRRTGFR